MAEIFLKARDDIIVAALDPMKYYYVFNQARRLTQVYGNRFLFSGYDYSGEVVPISAIFDISYFDMIYVACATYPETESMYTSRSDNKLTYRGRFNPKYGLLSS